MTTPTLPSAGAGALAVEPQQYLTFMLGTEVFAIGILSIKEIIEYDGITVVPMVPPSVRGVINLRGAVVPVIDPQVRFGRPSSPVTKRTCIVIVEVHGHSDADNQVHGVIVDAVNEVIEIAPQDIEPTPTFGAGLRSEFISGVGKVRGRFVLLLAVERALSVDISLAVQESGAEAERAHVLPTAGSDH